MKSPSGIVAGVVSAGIFRRLRVDAEHRPARGRGMTFFSFYAQPSCTPGRAAMQTGRIPNRSGMTTVAFQGQGGGLPAAEWTLASVLKQGGYKTCFTGKWHLGEGRLRAAERAGLRRHEVCRPVPPLNAYTYGDPDLVPDMDPELRAMFNKVTKGALSGKAGEKPRRLQDQRAVRQHSPARASSMASTIPAWSAFPSSTPTSRRRPSSSSTTRRRTPGQMILHQRQLHEGSPAEHAGAGVPAQVDVQEQVRRLGRRTRHAHRPHHGQAARSASTRTRWCSTRPTTAPGRTSIRTPAIRRSAAPRARSAKAATASGDRDLAGKIKPAVEPRHRRRLDLMATFARAGGVKPKNDREGQPIIFDSYDMTPVLTRHRQEPRKSNGSTSPRTN